MADLASPAWREEIGGLGPFEAVVSGFAIHHLPDRRKREIYAEILPLLRAGGVFLNLEHVSSESPWVEARFEDLFIDSLHAFHSPKVEGEDGRARRSREDVAREFYDRPDKEANILAPVDVQCTWLRELGYEDVDCYFKVFELALFGGRRAGPAG